MATLDADTLIRKLLANRGITTPEEIEAFLNPSYEEHTHDPFLLCDMDKAVARLLGALEKQETIGIFADYDCDGIPSAVVLHDFFKKIGHEHVQVYIPHRNKEGFGLNTQGIDLLKEKGVSLMVTVDCGISDRESVAHANTLGIDVIITDHHLEHGERPDALAIINPNKQGDTYPFKGLCGAGVAFKLVQALLLEGTKQKQFSIPTGYEKWLLDMVGLATLADMVPLVGENRVFASFGLLVLRKSRRPGLIHLCKKLRINQRYLTEDDIGFMLAPRINAASRMGEAMDAFRLLVTNDDVEAGALAAHLDHINNERKGVVASMIKEIKKRLQSREEIPEVLVVGDPRWMPSLLGLAATKLAEEYNRPVFLWGREGGETLKGSCRSEGVSDISQLMQHAKNSFIEFGGHAFSGGFSLEQENVHTLEERLCKAAKKMQKTKRVQEPLQSDCDVSLDDISSTFFDEINRLSPFGEGNRKPLFLFQQSTIKEVRQFGKGSEHLEVMLHREKGTPLKAIGFFTTVQQFSKRPEKNTLANIYATLEISRFMGKKELRLRLVAVE